MPDIDGFSASFMGRKHLGNKVKKGPADAIERQIRGLTERIEDLEKLVSRMARLEMAFQNMNEPRKPGRPKKVA